MLNGSNNSTPKIQQQHYWLDLISPLCSSSSPHCAPPCNCPVTCDSSIPLGKGESEGESGDRRTIMAKACQLPFHIWPRDVEGSLLRPVWPTQQPPTACKGKLSNVSPTFPQEWHTYDISYIIWHFIFLQLFFFQDHHNRWGWFSSLWKQKSNRLHGRS